MAMEGSSLLSCACSSYSSSQSRTKTNPFSHSSRPTYSPTASFPSSAKWGYANFIPKFGVKNRLTLVSSPRSSLRTWAFAVEEALEKSIEPPTASSIKETLPKIDKSGRFCSPRAARELALIIIYAACLEGSDPIRLFEKRMNVRREPGYEFDKASLLEYNHMSFGEPPVTTETVEEADELLRNDQKESAIEAEVLSAPPKLVYSKLLLRFTRKLLVAVVNRWDSHVLVIDKVAPPNWKNEPASRILELCILHLAMSEIAVLGTRHQIVINEAVDLAKRFCDGAAPRIINGCLRTFLKDIAGTGTLQASEAKQQVSAEA